MIIFLDGILVDKQPTSTVMNVAGVGYLVHIPLSSYDALPSEGERFRIWIYDCVREDDHQLYGFMSAAERRMFLMLMTVSGIGPKLALTALSGLTVRELTLAISGKDAKRLSSISGIGRKTAERMIVELQDKISAGDALEASTAGGALTELEIRTRDAILALISLGYKRGEAETLVRQVLETAAADDTVETLVRKALAG
jgi:Holliday junction DNA helicase RuvA